MIKLLLRFELGLGLGDRRIDKPLFHIYKKYYRI